MKITVVSGTEKQGVETALKEEFLRPFAGKAEIKEWYLPKDMPNFCCGCATCVTEGEGKCRDARYFMPIWKSIEAADLIVFVTPVYAGHAPAALKNLLDHFEWAWMTHRPRPAMFGKRAVVLVAGGGAGAESAAADIVDSLNWWGVADVCRVAADPQSGTAAATEKLRLCVARYLRTNFRVPAKTPYKIKKRFKACLKARLQTTAAAPADGEPSPDTKYWQDNGWFGNARPWLPKG